MMEIEVKGHSGCSIDIVREDNDLFIYKSSRDKKYLSRLILQAEKQQKASMEEYQHVRIPQIFNVEQDAEHVSVKMEYVYSRNFIEYFETAGFEQIKYFIDALILFIEREIKRSVIQNVPTSVTMEKFLDVAQKINSNALLKDDLDIKDILHKAKERIDTLCTQPSITIPVGICHGDLTFSNILFNGNNYYLIDFLDSFIESPLMDIVKIRQDSYHLWSQLMYIKPYDKLRLKIICEKIDNEIDNYFSKYKWYKEYYKNYQLLNLLRILQYVKEPKVVDYLKIEIKRILHEAQATKQESPTKFNDINNEFSLIVPVAADNASQSNAMPYVFSLDQSGIMLCIRSIQGLNLETFDNIYFTILRKHAQLFCLDEMFKLQFKRLGLNNAHLVILDNPTKSQVETVQQTLTQEGIKGSIFVKDADGFFTGEVRRENGVAVFALENLEMVDPRHKSYVSLDDMYYVTNIIEKRIISHYFNVGGICLENTDTFQYYYRHLLEMSDDGKMCMSHIVYAMLLDKLKFRPIMAKDYKDYGTELLFNYHNMHK
jgi:tRNA A-37 threonylcarbamoyl transferase component Bud32